MMTNLWIFIGIFMALVVVTWFFIRHRDQSIKSLEEKLKEETRKEEVDRMVYKKEQVLRYTSEKALRMKILLNDNLAQEIKSLLVSISGYADMLTIAGADFEEERNSLGNLIQNGVHRLTDIANKMGELSHYELLKEVDLRESIHVNDFSKDVINSYRRLTPVGVELIFETGLNDDFMVHTNKECLVKILYHLLDTALRHTKEGSVTLTVTDDGRRDHVNFTISDTGSGIPKRYQNKIFEELPEVGAELKLTGLDLMISRTLVKLLDGVIYVDPHYEAGTRVVFGIKG